MGKIPKNAQEVLFSLAIPWFMIGRVENRTSQAILMNRSIIRTFFLCGLVLLMAGMGPAVLAAIPRAMAAGSEEETRHSESHLIRVESRLKVRPARRGSDLSNVAQKKFATPAFSHHGQSKQSVTLPRSLRALQIQIEV